MFANYPRSGVFNFSTINLQPEECSAGISNTCACNNWMILKFTVIMLNIIHFVLQCIFYLRYNSFDPQQYQIDCVQEYSFVGNNLTLFLSHPGICFLSVLETGILVIGWLGVILQPGLQCSNSHEINGVAIPTFIYSYGFAAFLTFMEVYKANMSTSTKYLRQWSFGWSIWSLLRVDLFIFYGFTLFLQTFIFPFSLLGYCTNRIRGVDNKSKIKTNNDDRSTIGGDVAMTAVTGVVVKEVLYDHVDDSKTDRSAGAVTGVVAYEEVNMEELL